MPTPLSRRKTMDKLILWTGNIAGLLGILLCAISGAGRLSGAYLLAGLEAGTLFLLGVGLMVFACLTKLHLLVERAGTR
jgi:hypothetical protein